MTSKHVFVVNIKVEVGMNPELPGVNLYITTCLHGVDLRFVPRCYLCKPAERDEAIWQVTPSGHVHRGEWCEACVEHGVTLAPTPPDITDDGCPVCGSLQHERPGEHDRAALT